jgi:hypothetical protein
LGLSFAAVAVGGAVFEVVGGLGEVEAGAADMVEVVVSDVDDIRAGSETRGSNGARALSCPTEESIDSVKATTVIASTMDFAAADRRLAIRPGRRAWRGPEREWLELCCAVPR